MSAAEIWNTLASVNVGDKIEKKANLSYLSWAWAWGELMKVYPNATYKFDDPVTFPDSTVEVWCHLTIGDVTRSMWLPVMDHRNNSIVKPSSRQISDTRMRCLTKCMAMFGLGHYIYAGEDMPDPDVAEQKAEADYKALCDELAFSIGQIKEGIETGDLTTACLAWREIPQEKQMIIWKAPSNGGCFTTKEREIMKSKEFREAGNI